jgi:hypothetical protein
MVEKQMQLLAKKHGDWKNIVNSFGGNQALSEDLVQEMYIKIFRKLKADPNFNIMYGEEINYVYVFKTLRTLFLDLQRKHKNIYLTGIDNIGNMESDVDYTDKYKLVQEALTKMYWYDRKVFEIINSGESIASLSRKTGIQYYSLYNTYRKVKHKLMQLL